MDIKKAVGFNWNDGNINHCQKHGVSLGEIEDLFLNDPAVLDDPFSDEKRFRAIGKNNAGRFVFVVFMLKKINKELYIRPVSARYMHTKEIERYE